MAEGEFVKLPHEASRNAFYCKKCGMIVESKSVHDFQECKCGNFTDGGMEYIRRGGHFEDMVDIDELVFRENKDKYVKPCIEVGRWNKGNDGKAFFSTIVDICPSEKWVVTDCGDTYYDYSIGFDDLLAIADKIKEMKGKL